MSTRHRRSGALAAVVVLLATACFAAPATADAGTFKDAKRDVEHFSGRTQTVTYGPNGLDIYWTRVRYADGRLVVRTRFHNLTGCNTEALDRCRPWRPDQYVYLDTSPDPETEQDQFEYYAFHLDHHSGLSTYDAGDRSCPGLRWRADLRRETSTFVIPRSCLRHGDRHRVRVQVMASTTGRASRSGHTDLVTDVLDRTPWVRYG